ncbi:MAG: GGDEF domain-containing protein [Gammaproteobacteria bacterium]|nr:MAG: GGDEF domain-containing protein [Pseudomonadota bacterium]PIE38338.1 MAG: GGDEF domain-containing protein [Gammaproteobacteria bacterium]
MTKDTPPQSEAARWKDKYFTLMEESDNKISSLTEQTTLLQRMLVRVSMAAQGQNEELDKELSGLRDLLRQTDPSARSLAARTEKVEQVVIRMDDHRANSSGLMLESLEKLISQLAGLNISKANKKQLKRFSRQMKTRLNRWQECPALLSEYASLQEMALKETMTKGEPEQQGFFQKLFSGRNETPDDDKGEPEELARPDEGKQEPTDDIALPDTADPAKEEVYSDRETDLAIEGTVLAADEEGLEPEFSSVSGHIGSSLKNLLEQLIIPESSIDEARRLRANIESGLNWHDLGTTLDDLASLVISAVSKGQRDFENFLKHMDGRLARFKDFLGESRTQHLKWQGSSSRLDKVLKGYVGSIATAMEESTDIDELKANVSQKLDSILENLSEYMQKEEERELSLQEQIDTMQQRFKSMEQETGKMRERLKKEHDRALTDALTNLPNREAYEERMALEYDRWLRYRHPMVLIVADIDHFKTINDSYGHLTGDRVLQIMARELRRRIRKTDFMARYGGEEFVILMPETKVDIAKMVMDKARQMVENLPFHFRNERVQITMSFGVARLEEGYTREQQFERADKALYEAKQSGRNCVVVAP